MAQPSNELNNLRGVVTRLLNDSIPELAAAVALIDGSGDTDQERAAFFAEAFGEGLGNDDLDSATFNAGALAIRAIQTAFDDNLQELYALRK